MRTGKSDVKEGTGVSKNGRFKLGGSAKVRVDLKTGDVKFEGIKTNPNVKGSDELLKLPSQLKGVKMPIKVEVPTPEITPPEAPIKVEEPFVAPETPIEPIEPISLPPLL